jgi:hypothetical protein
VKLFIVFYPEHQQLKIKAMKKTTSYYLLNVAGHASSWSKVLRKGGVLSSFLPKPSEELA